MSDSLIWVVVPAIFIFDLMDRKINCFKKAFGEGPNKDPFFFIISITKNCLVILVDILVSKKL